MSDEFKDAFNALSTNEKRNQISNELILIGELIKNIKKKYEVPSLINIKNYDASTDNNLTEDEMLLFLYEDIYNIQKELITILSITNIKNK